MCVSAKASPRGRTIAASPQRFVASVLACGYFPPSILHDFMCKCSVLDAINLANYSASASSNLPPLGLVKTASPTSLDVMELMAVKPTSKPHEVMLATARSHSRVRLVTCLLINHRCELLLLNRNQVAFTPTQIEAIRSGMQPGLTMVINSSLFNVKRCFYYH
jgi:hypothetical protein